MVETPLLQPPRFARHGAEAFYTLALPRPEVDSYKLRAVAKDRQYFGCRFRFGETLADASIVQKFGNRRKRPEVRLKLIFWHNEKNDELHRRVVERIEFNPAGRPSKRSHDLVKAVGGAMGNGDPESDAGAHGFLALFE
jgi:hypothetical protein